MTTKQIDEELFKTVQEWFKSYNWPMERWLVSDRGFVSYINDKPISAGWLYVCTGSQLGFMDWLVANPETSPEERAEGIKILLERIHEEAKEAGLKRFITITEQPTLMEKLESNGFYKTDENVTIFMKTV